MSICLDMLDKHYTIELSYQLPRICLAWRVIRLFLKENLMKRKAAHPLAEIHFYRIAFFNRSLV